MCRFQASLLHRCDAWNPSHFTLIRCFFVLILLDIIIRICYAVFSGSSETCSPPSVSRVDPSSFLVGAFGPSPERTTGPPLVRTKMSGMLLETDPGSPLGVWISLLLAAPVPGAPCVLLLLGTTRWRSGLSLQFILKGCFFNTKKRRKILRLFWF